MALKPTSINYDQACITILVNDQPLEVIKDGKGNDIVVVDIEDGSLVPYKIRVISHTIGNIEPEFKTIRGALTVDGRRSKGGIISGPGQTELYFSHLDYELLAFAPLECGANGTISGIQLHQVGIIEIELRNAKITKETDIGGHQIYNPIPNKIARGKLPSYKLHTVGAGASQSILDPRFDCEYGNYCEKFIIRYADRRALQLRGLLHTEVIEPSSILTTMKSESDALREPLSTIDPDSLFATRKRELTEEEDADSKKCYKGIAEEKPMPVLKFEFV